MIDLKCGDCLELMKEIPNESIDLIITDPPYLHIKGGMKSKRLNVGVRESKSEVVSKMSDFNEYEIYKFLNEVKNKMKKINMYIFCSKLQIVYYLNWAIKNKYQYDLLFWYKNTNRMISTKFYAPNVEYIIRIYDKGCSLKNRKNENGKAISELYQKIFIYDTPKQKIHEAQKPIEILKKMILVSSEENDTILDCFMGSGTTGVACVELNRNFIGIEIDEHYFKIAKERIEEEKRGE